MKHEERTIATPRDQGPGSLPKESMRRRNGTEARQPALWTTRETMDLAHAPLGQLPKGFLRFAMRALQAPASRTLQVCSGALPPGCGTRVDIRPLCRPDVVADGRALPFRDGAFAAAMVDPPYSVDYAQDLYGTSYPRPSHLLAEAARCIAPGGRLAILHFLVPQAPEGCKMESCTGITTGAGYRIRAFTVYRKADPRLL